jgi:urease beta subunit
MEPGEYFLEDDQIEINAGRRTVTLAVHNTSDRAVQVGSHFHFFEVNKALDFDRAAAMGMHLNIIAGTTLRFEPGDTRYVELVEYTGRRRAVGFSNLVDGSVTSVAEVLPALERARLLGFKGVPASEARDDTQGGR